MISTLKWCTFKLSPADSENLEEDRKRIKNPISYTEVEALPPFCSPLWDFSIPLSNVTTGKYSHLEKHILRREKRPQFEDLRMYFNSRGTDPPNQLAIILTKWVTRPYCGEFFFKWKFTFKILQTWELQVFYLGQGKTLKIFIWKV